MRSSSLPTAYLPAAHSEVLNATTFRDLVCGRKKGPLATCLRGGLRLCEIPYSWVTSIRNRRYDRGRAEIHHVGVPVISVGNLTLGGTGKTPLVEWLVRHFRQQDVGVAIVSRGYGAELGQRNDEALELELALPDVPHLQNANRVEAARTAVDQFDAQWIVLDDGFQHRRLARDLDIVLLDATEPFGFEHVFPRGTLREPLAGLARAQVVILSRADMLAPAQRKQIQERVADLSPDAIWCEVVHQPAALLDAHGNQQPLTFSPKRRIVAFCGIGNPAGFRHTLATLDCQIAAWREFSDHHRYTSADIESLADWAADADQVVCTRKDLVKLGVTKLGETPLHAVSVQICFVEGESAIVAELDALCQEYQFD